MSSRIKDEVIAEVEKITLRHDLHLDQRLDHDLGITGDDAAELIDNIHHQFGTRFEGFVFRNYFSDEPDLITSWLERIFKSLIREKPLTVRHLAKVVEAGAWFDP